MRYLSAGSKTAYEKLLSAARLLFYNNGIDGTGIDTIVKRAGVGLIVACLGIITVPAEKLRLRLFRPRKENFEIAERIKS